MKISLYWMLLVMLAFSCNPASQNNKNTEKGISSFAEVSKNIIDTAKAYLGREVSHPVFSIGNNGAIIIRGESTEFFIDPSDINIGQMDSDKTEDGIVSCAVTLGGKYPFRKHLLILNNGYLHVVKEFVSDMKVMQISKRIVYAERPIHSANSPLHDCHVCKENVMYKLAGDSLQEVKQP